MCKFANNTKHSRIDHCMRTFVILLSHYLEKHDVKVIACCCGHGVYPMTILIKGKPYDPFKLVPQLLGDLQKAFYAEIK